MRKGNEAMFGIYNELIQLFAIASMIAVLLLAAAADIHTGIVFMGYPTALLFCTILYRFATPSTAFDLGFGYFDAISALLALGIVATCFNIQIIGSGDALLLAALFPMSIFIPTAVLIFGIALIFRWLKNNHLIEVTRLPFVPFLALIAGVLLVSGL
jgi:hypothetical protein